MKVAPADPVHLAAPHLCSSRWPCLDCLLVLSLRWVVGTTGKLEKERGEPGGTRALGFLSLGHHGSAMCLYRPSPSSYSPCALLPKLSPGPENLTTSGAPRCCPRRPQPLVPQALPTPSISNPSSQFSSASHFECALCFLLGPHQDTSLTG